MLRSIHFSYTPKDNLLKVIFPKMKQFILQFSITFYYLKYAYYTYEYVPISEYLLLCFLIEVSIRANIFVSKRWSNVIYNSFIVVTSCAKLSFRANHRYSNKIIKITENLQ